LCWKLQAHGGLAEWASNSEGSIVAGHDGIDQDAPSTIAAMPGIVEWMNAHHLGYTNQVAADASGGDLLPHSTSSNNGTA